MSKLSTVFILASSICLSASEAVPPGPLRVAVLFSKSTGEEFQCVAKAMQLEADKAKIAIKFELFDFDNTTSELLIKSKNIIMNRFDLVIGPRTSQEALITKPLFSKAKIPQMLPLASHPDLRSNEGLVITMVPSALRYNDLVVKFVLRKLRSKTILIAVNDSRPISVVSASLFQTLLKRHGFKGKFETIRLINGYPEYDQIATKAIEIGADLVYAPLFGVDIAEIYSALSRMKVKTILFAGAGIFELRDIAKRFNPENVRLLFNGIWDGKIRGRYALNFRQIIKDSCLGNAAGIRIPMAYDTFRLLMEVAASNPRARGAELGKLLQTYNFSGLLGKRSFDKKGELLLPMPIFEVKNNKFRLFYVVH